MGRSLSQVFCQVLCLESLTPILLAQPEEIMSNELTLFHYPTESPPALAFCMMLMSLLTSFLSSHGRTILCRTQLYCARELKPGG